MDNATLTNQNQITVPMRLRDKLSLKPGDKLSFYDVGDSVVVSKLKSIEDFKGFLDGAKKKLSKQDTENTWLERFARYETQEDK